MPSITNQQATPIQQPTATRFAKNAARVVAFLSATASIAMMCLASAKVGSANALRNQATFAGSRNDRWDCRQNNETIRDLCNNIKQTGVDLPFKDCQKRLAGSAGNKEGVYDTCTTLSITDNGTVDESTREKCRPVVDAAYDACKNYVNIKRRNADEQVKNDDSRKDQLFFGAAGALALSAVSGAISTKL